MVMKYNPVTNRFENQSAGVSQVDSPPAGTAEMQFYVDQKTGQYKQREYNGLGQPDKVVSSVVVPAGQRGQKASYQPIVPVSGAKANPNWQPTAGQTTTKGQTVKQPTGTKSTTTTTVPATKTGGSKTGAKAGASAGGFRQFDQNTTAPVGEAYSQQELELIKQYLGTIVTDPAQLNTLLAGLDGGSTGGSGGSGSAAAIKAQASADAAKAQRAANKRGAADLIKAGQTAQTAYNQMGEQQASDITKRAGEYYGGQKTTALANIDAATTDFFKNLIAPSAYANAATAQLTPEQQGLMQNLQAYGASGGQAAQQMSQDVANNQFMADLMRSSNKGLQSAEADYFNSLRNAATGGQMAARQGLENLITGFQGQAQSDADKLKRDYLLKGLEALISGQTNAANMLAGQ